MTTSLDNTLLSEVLTILQEYGATATWERKSTGSAFDPVAGAYTGTATNQSWTVKVLPPGNYVKYWSNGEPVVASKLQSGVAGKDLAFTPANGDFITIGVSSFIVTKVYPIFSGDQVCLWVVDLDR